MICTHPECESLATRVVRFWVEDVRGAMHTWRCSYHVALGGVVSRVESEITPSGYTCPVCEQPASSNGCETCDAIAEGILR